MYGSPSYFAIGYFDGWFPGREGTFNPLGLDVDSVELLFVGNVDAP